MRPTVILFDIDGTILNTGGAGRRAFERAFAQVCGSDEGAKKFRFDGMTDRGIARRGLVELGLVPDEATIDALVAGYLQHLQDELPRTTGFVVYPAIREVTEVLAKEGHAVGLGTGNVKAGAEAKLRVAGLWDLFAFGGFGCDAEDRAELLRAGARRGAERLGVSPEECRVVVVGDTVKDVDAALAIGAECIAVGTGGKALDELASRGAHHTFVDLSGASALAALLGR
jgi:phosphoglycolate phosphatase